MKIQIVYSIDASNEYRRAINLHLGRSGLASRSQVRDFHMAYGVSRDAEIMIDLEAHERAQPQMSQSTARDVLRAQWLPEHLSDTVIEHDMSRWSIEDRSSAGRCRDCGSDDTHYSGCPQRHLGQ